MEFISIFNDVMGPVMRGPSSSHTAGSYRIGRIARSLFGEQPSSVAFTFDPEGSYIKTYRQQGVDLAFAAGLMGWQITDERFFQALEFASKHGIKIEFNGSSLDNPDHPNTVLIQMVSQSGQHLSLKAKSVGGGIVAISRLDNWPVNLSGKYYEIITELKKDAEPQVRDILESDDQTVNKPSEEVCGNMMLLCVQRLSALSPKVRCRLEKLPEVKNIREVRPLFYMKRGEALFSSAEEMVAKAESCGCSLGKIALNYESKLLGMTEKEALCEMLRRFDIMKASVLQGLNEQDLRMQLLRPCAKKIYEAEAKGKVALGGIHTRAAARAMAAMHVNNSMGIVCAAPTGGSAGVIPGVMCTLAEEKNLDAGKLAMALFAASAVGLIVAKRATFAAEVAGCQVEIGAAGAMAAAAVIEAADGSAQQAADAASIVFQNTMGSVCDLVQGMCEIPCHTRNAVAASNAFVCADLILGGYVNSIPLDETIDAVCATGKMLPQELRCTSLGGIAAVPSALSMPRIKKDN